jgi:hypothetical protein
VHSQFFAAVLAALTQAANSSKHSWQHHAGAITESARKLFTYGTQQPLQQHQQQGGSANGCRDAVVASKIAPAAPSATATPAAAASNQGAPKRSYIPPHARAAAAAAQPQQQDLSDESEQSASDWSDMSDSEYLLGSSSRRASSSSSRDRSKLKQQQQQQLQDPIKAVRVRTALLQLLQLLVQADSKALHPYWSALLPSQAPLHQSPLSPHLLTMLLYDPNDKVGCTVPSSLCQHCHLSAVTLMQEELLATKSEN